MIAIISLYFVQFCIHIKLSYVTFVLIQIFFPPLRRRLNAAALCEKYMKISVCDKTRVVTIKHGEITGVVETKPLSLAFARLYDNLQMQLISLALVAFCERE
jgi:transposase